MKRKISLFPVPYGDIPKDAIVVVIDVIRATSTITTFFGEGGRALFIVEKIEEAFSLKSSLPYRAFIAGERGGKKVEGFDFDNSPLHIKDAELFNKILILTTTNGTRVIKKYSSVRHLFVGSFLNFKALVDVMIILSNEEGLDIYLVCAGKDKTFIMDDFLCGGAYIEALLKKGDFELKDSAKISYEYYKLKQASIKECLLGSESGKNILRFGKRDDIEFLSRMNVYNTVPYLFDRERLLLKDFLKREKR